MHVAGHTRLNPLYATDSKICTLTNNEDPDEMPHYAAFHQGLHIFSKNQSVGKEILLKAITCEFRYLQWIIPRLLYLTRWKIPLVHKGLTLIRQEPLLQLDWLIYMKYYLFFIPGSDMTRKF